MQEAQKFAQISAAAAIIGDVAEESVELLLEAQAANNNGTLTPEQQEQMDLIATHYNGGNPLTAEQLDTTVNFMAMMLNWLTNLELATGKQAIALQAALN